MSLRYCPKGEYRSTRQGMTSLRPASQASQRPADARLLHLDAQGRMQHLPRNAFVDVLHPGDLVIANDAATLPASLAGVHTASGATIEVRLAGRRSLRPEDVHEFSSVVFGSGDFHTRTEQRPPPPPLTPGDRLELGPLRAEVLQRLGHPRLIALRFEGSADDVWAGLARHGRPIQYAHLAEPLALWDVWAPIAAEPVAFEPPSAGFALDWQALAAMRNRGIAFATLTHAAGISSTGDPRLDRCLPFDEPYRIPLATLRAIEAARARGGRIVAVGTTVVRALEHSASRHDGLQAGEAIARQRLGAGSRLQIVDAILSGTHEPGSSHYDLLRAFTDDTSLRRADAELQSKGYRTHEFGDSVLIERRHPANRSVAAPRSGPHAADACAPISQRDARAPA